MPDPDSPHEGTHSGVADTDPMVGPANRLEAAEEEFWVGVIKRYLVPLEVDLEHQTQVRAQLLDLRNKATLSFFMMNAIFVVVIFTLQVIHHRHDTCKVCRLLILNSQVVVMHDYMNNCTYHNDNKLRVCNNNKHRQFR